MHRNTEMTYKEQGTEIPQQNSQYRTSQPKKKWSFLRCLQIKNKVLNTVHQFNGKGNTYAEPNSTSKGRILELVLDNRKALIPSFLPSLSTKQHIY
jgi:hypothetical protein